LRLEPSFRLGKEGFCQQLEVITEELLPGEPVPLLNHRRELSREAAIKFWGERRKEGCASCGLTVVSCAALKSSSGAVAEPRLNRPNRLPELR